MKDSNSINFLNSPLPVSMADEWYTHATAEHFWVRHRNEVIREHFGNLICERNEVAEVGCGSGLVLSYLSEVLHRRIDGFELNLDALKLCPKVSGLLYIYDFLQRQSDYLEKYDLLIMMDVLEHIENEQEFLRAIRDHITPQGYLIVGVPMRQHLYSSYDRAAGHHRRYDQNYLKSVVESSGFKVVKSVQWGHVYLPLLVIRKLFLGSRRLSRGSIVKQGFASSSFVNRMLCCLRILDVLPTFNSTGTSSMILVQKI